LKAYGERLALKQIFDSHIENGIIVSAKKIFNGECEVHSIGSKLKTDLKIGDRVLVAEGAGALIKRGGEELLFCTELSIIAIL
jgi:co-chaperonin GroES (HSP10)